MKHLILIFSLISILSCKKEEKNLIEESKKFSETIFPKAKNVDEIQNTDFVSTFESKLNSNQNIIYSVTLPFAWNEIKNEINFPITNINGNALKELNQTNSFQNTLNKNEYETEVVVQNQIIKAKAYFRKSLPFSEPFHKYDEPLKFDNQNVENFGFGGEDSNAKINFYKDDLNFSISLLPADKEHEIILMMTEDSTLNSFAQYFELFKKEVENQKSEGFSWKSHFTYFDKVRIPMIEFNLKKKFKELIGNQFQAKNLMYEIVDVNQQNAFVLNEKGAEVESMAAMDAAASAEEIKPKHLIFNKPFVVFLKRKNSDFPYFAVYISNTELLKNLE